MKLIFSGFLLSLLMITGCKEKVAENPFFGEWKTPYGTVPFDKITTADYMPAFVEGMKQQKVEIEAIVNNTAAPTFDNTLVALDKSGALLKKVSYVFFNLSSADTNDSIQAIAKQLSPMLSAHNDDINLNEGLFKRVKAVYTAKERLSLEPDQLRLLDKIYKDFVRGGADLTPEQKTALRPINERLSMLSLQFGDNVLADNNAFKLFITDTADLAGLPEAVRATAAAAAKADGKDGQWLFTIDKPSMLPFLTYAKNRELRKKLYDGYINKGNNGGSTDNNAIIAEIVNLRSQKAKLFGFENHAAYVLDVCMAKTPQNVYDLLDKVWAVALPAARNEVKEMQKIIDAEGGKFKLEMYDWWYYADKVRMAKYNLSDEELMPYFEINNVRKGLFDVVNKLYGLNIKPLKDVAVYNKDVLAWEVTEANGDLVGILYTDYYVRPSKRAGAWMENYRDQEMKDGKRSAPIIVNVCNFSAPSETMPSLLSLDDVTTMFHEFGHALHGLLSDCRYVTLSGTAVARDFVELPSQIMENWATQPEVLKSYAKHYKTGEVIPDALVQKIQNASAFNQGFATTEYVAAALLDMAYHTLDKWPGGSAIAFENKVLVEKYGLIPEIVSRYRSTYYQHIFSGGYSAGYYAYMWAEVLDADAFNAFLEKGLFDQTTAKSFRDNVLSKGNTDEPMTLYKNFRGQAPSIEPLLKRRGLMK